jgi:ABC-2 type transport system permease protein
MADTTTDKGPVARLGWGLRVLRGYARIGWVRKSQFRWEFVNQVIMDVMFYVSFVLTFKMLYGLGEGAESGALSLAGWSYGDMKVYLGMAFVADALMMTFLGQQWHFGGDLKNGALDPFRVRPGPTAFLYFFQRFSPEGLTNLIIASGWLVYALSGVVGSQVSLLHLAWTLPLSVVVLAWCQVFMMMAYNLVELWLTHSDLGHLTWNLFSSMGERPLDVYPSGIQRFLTFVVPVAGLAWYPAALVLGKLDPVVGIAFPLVLLAFAWIVARVFRAGLRRYDSAMG